MTNNEEIMIQKAAQLANAHSDYMLSTAIEFHHDLIQHAPDSHPGVEILLMKARLCMQDHVVYEGGQ